MAEQARAPDGRVIVWQPQPGPQTALLSCPIFEVLFGGARGGGKTDGVLGDWAQHASQYGEHAIGLMVRRNSIQLGETFERAKAIFQPIGGRFVGSPQTGSMGCFMPGGARLLFRYLERDKDAENYQGHGYTRIYVEEAGNFPSPAPILKLMAALRSGAGVPCRMRLTANPGGPGHHWLKARYIDPAPLGMKILEDPDSGLQRIYIPSRLKDNRFLGDQYVGQLKQSGSAELVRAWLDGDWDVIAGAYFPEFTVARHVRAPFTLPPHWTRFRAMDWGSSRPFCVLWFAVSAGDVKGIPKGALVVYREYYGSTGEPNVGLRIFAEVAARNTRQREAKDEDISYGVCDPACFDDSGGPSIAERWGKEGVYFRAADHARTSRDGKTGGWDMVRARLQGMDDVPMLYVFSTCTNLIRTLPAQQHSSSNPEDMDSDGEDHAVDTLRYGCASRPWVAPIPQPPKPRDSWDSAFGDDDDDRPNWRTV